MNVSQFSQIIFLSIFAFALGGCAATNNAQSVKQPPRETPQVIGGNKSEACRRYMPAPYFPEAQRDRQEGWVILEYSVGADGRLNDFHIIDSSPPGYFEKGALNSAQKYNERAGEGATASAVVGCRHVYRFLLEQ